MLDEGQKYPFPSLDTFKLTGSIGLGNKWKIQKENLVRHALGVEAPLVKGCQGHQNVNKIIICTSSIYDKFHLEESVQ